MSENGFNRSEKKAAIGLSLVFAMRMLGLFMLLPVLSIYGQQIPGYSPSLLGLALGAYGLSQALLQVPMGWLSDRFGRKIIIVFGLLVFALGSVVAANADSMHALILGRLIQGMGAVASTIMALAADLSRESQRAKVMASIGMSIGLSFSIALVLGPLLASFWGLSGLFYCIAAGAVISIAVVLWFIPNAELLGAKADSLLSIGDVGALVKDQQLALLNFGVFVLHFLMTALFVGLPSQLQNYIPSVQSHAWYYLPILLLSFCGMVPMLILAARNNANRQFFQFAIVLMLSGFLLFSVASSLSLFLVALLLFFVGFNFMEASMPALLSSLAPAGKKGTALGLYSSCQFGGAFVGGAISGLLIQRADWSSVLLLGMLVLVIWLFFTRKLRAVSGVTNVSLVVDERLTSQQVQAKVAELEGVIEAVVLRQEQRVYLKVERKQFNLQKAMEVLQSA